MHRCFPSLLHVGDGRRSCLSFPLWLVFALAAASLSMGSARAQEETQQQLDIEVGAFGGGHFFSDSNELGRSNRPTEGNVLKSSGAVGARVGLGIGRHFMPEIELAIVPTETLNELTGVVVLGWRAHLLYHVLAGRLRPFLLAGGGGLSSFSRNQEVSQNQTFGLFHAGVGLKLDLFRSVGLRLDGRVLLPSEVKRVLAPDWEVFGGLYANFGFGRPAAPAPPKVVDTDGDGVPDGEDRCPQQAGIRDNGGCPDGDGDGDGVVDRLDKCPMEAGPKERAGCPEKDSDADGLLDGQDKCPQQAGPKENEGCPDKDGDGDGIVDRLDKCPEQAESKNNYQDEDGCPDEIPAAVKKFTGAIQGVSFEPNKAVITKGSFPVLDKAFAVLGEFPDVKLEIGGHTDSVGKAEANKDLSQRRAEAVKAYLVEKGIAAERLKAIGYGLEKPVGNNKTAAGRAKNRRVEFQLIN